MKTINLIILFLSLVFTTQAQSLRIDTSHLDRDLEWVLRSDTVYQYIRYQTEHDGRSYVEDHYKSGALFMTGSYIQALFNIPDGHFVYYAQNGAKIHEYSYADSLKDGDEIYRDSLGHTEYEMHYTHGRLNGPLKGYYPSGKLHRDEMYKDSVRVSGICYDEHGKEQAYYPREEMPEFPGGETEMMHLMQQKIIYPDMERENDIQGSVVVKFEVLEDGSISDIRVVKHISNGLDETSLNVVRQFPKFKPGKKEGKICATTFTLPIMFKLASE